jgi:hypothetical protein
MIAGTDKNKRAGRYMEIWIEQPAKDYILTKAGKAIALEAKEWAGGV